jgi:hypothetical protein
MAFIKVEKVVTELTNVTMGKGGQTIGQQIDNMIAEALGSNQVIQQVGFHIEPEEWHKFVEEENTVSTPVMEPVAMSKKEKPKY